MKTHHEPNWNALLIIMCQFILVDSKKETHGGDYNKTICFTWIFFTLQIHIILWRSWEDRWFIKPCNCCGRLRSTFWCLTEPKQSHCAWNQSNFVFSCRKIYYWQCIKRKIAQHFGKWAYWPSCSERWIYHSPPLLSEYEDWKQVATAASVQS